MWCDLRRTPIKQDPCHPCLLWIVSYVRAGAIHHVAKVLVRTLDDVWGRNEWLDWDENVHDCFVGQCLFEEVEFLCVSILPGTWHKC